MVKEFSIRELNAGRIFTALCRYYKQDEEFRDSINLNFNITNKLCSWCSSEINHRLTSIDFTIEEYSISITAVKYNDIHYCGSDSCKVEYKKYNTNSSYKIMLNHNLESEIAAKEWIRNNNKSPFYKENHKTLDEYAESQRRNQDKERWDLMTEKANYSRSLNGYIRRYGDVEGVDRFNLTCVAKGHSIDNFVKKYGEIEGLDRFNNLVKSKVAKNGSYFGVISYTEKGERLLSSYELTFYNYICTYGLLDYYDVGMYYGGRYGHRSDFYFGILNLHIEIAGMMHHEQYRNKMKLKQELYKETCLVVLPEHMEQIVIDISHRIRELEQ